MSARHGPLPQWEMVGSYGSGTFQAEDLHGIIWRLWLMEQPADDDLLPPGYRLAPRDDPSNPTFITRDHGLYHALDMAGMQIATNEVHADPQGARQQLGLEEQAHSADRTTEQ